MDSLPAVDCLYKSKSTVIVSPLGSSLQPPSQSELLVVRQLTCQCTHEDMRLSNNRLRCGLMWLHGCHSLSDSHDLCCCLTPDRGPKLGIMVLMKAMPE